MDQRDSHNNQGDKIHRASLVDGLGDKVHIKTWVDLAKLEPERAEGKPSALHVPEGHSHAAEAFDQPDTAVCMEEELAVHQMLGVDVSWPAGEGVSLWLLVGERHGAETVGETTDDNLCGIVSRELATSDGKEGYHEERRKDLRKPENHADHDRPCESWSVCHPY